MPFSFTAGQDATLARLSRPGSEMIWLVRLQTLAHLWLQVTDYTAPNLGDQIHVQADATASYVVLTLAAAQSGTSFARGATNVGQAANIATAARALGIRAVAEGSWVHFVANSSFDTLSFNQIDDASWVDLSANAVSLSSAPLSRLQRFLSKPVSALGYDPIVQEVSPLGWKKDVRTKRWQISDITIRFTDEGRLRNIINRCPLMRKQIQVLFGDEYAVEADFVPAGTYVYADHATSGGAADTTEGGPASGSISLIGRDYVTWLLQRSWVTTGDDYAPSRVNKMPLEELDQILQFASIPTSIYDASTLSVPVSGPAWDHYNIGRFNYDAEVELYPAGGGGAGPQVAMAVESDLAEKPNLLDVVDELRLAIKGQFGPEEDGVWRYQNRSITLDSPVRTWTRDIFTPDTPDTYAENAMSELTTNILDAIRAPDFEKRFVYEDVDASILNAGDFDAAGTPPPDALGGRIGTTGWQNGAGYLKRTGGLNVGLSSQALPVWLEVEFAGLTPFCGAGYDGKIGSGGSNTIDADRQLNGGSKVAYIMLEAQAGGNVQLTSDINDRPAHREIFRVVDVREAAGGVYPVWDINGGSYTGVPDYFPRVELQIDQRALFGTTTPFLWWQGARVIDVTIALEWAQELIERARFGMPIITGTTRLDQWDVQIGEKVVVPHSSFAMFRNDGAVSCEFEVVGKRIDRGRVHWTLAFARHADLVQIVPVVSPLVPIVPTPTAIQPGDYYYDASGVDYVDPSGDKYWRVF